MAKRYLIVVPNMRNRRSHPVHAVSLTSSATSSLGMLMLLELLGAGFFTRTPYSFRQHSNALADDFNSMAECSGLLEPGVVGSAFCAVVMRSLFAVVCRRADLDAAAVLRSSRSPQRTKSFSRTSAKAVEFLRRLWFAVLAKGLYSCQELHVGSLFGAHGQ